MSTIGRYVELLSLGTWVGGIIFLSLVVAPGAFLTISNRDVAGTVVALALSRLHLLGYLAGGLFLVARMARLRSLTTLASPSAAAVVLMLILTAFSQEFVSARMVRLRTEMGSVEATPANDARRLEFSRLHRVSVRLEVAILLAGLAALYFVVREPTH